MMRAWLALVLDPLVLASRRRVLWVYLILSTLVAAGATLGLGVSIDVHREVELRADGPVQARFDVPLDQSLVFAVVGDATEHDAVREDGGRLLGLGIDGVLDRAGGVVTLRSTPAAVGSAAPLRASVVASIPLAALSGDARSRLLDEGRGLRIQLFGVEYDQKATRAPRDAVPAQVTTYLYFVLVWALASLFGVCLGLLAMADSVSSAFDPGQAELLLSRPVGRAQVVLGRFAGGMIFGTLQVLWLLGLACLIVGLRLGVWVPGLLLTAAPLLVKFALLLAVTTLGATVGRTTILGLAAALGTWACSYAVEQARDHEGLLNRRLVETVDRIIPHLTRLDEVSGLLIGADMNADALDPSGPYAIAQCIAWTALSLGLTTVVVSRRDH